MPASRRARVNHVGHPYPVKGRQNDDVMPLGMVGRKANPSKGREVGYRVRVLEYGPWPLLLPCLLLLLLRCLLLFLPRLELTTYVPVVKSEMSAFGRLRELRPPRAPGTKVLG